MTEDQALWLLIEIGVIAVVMLVTFLAGYRRGPRP